MKRWRLILGQSLVTLLLLGWFFREPGFRHQLWETLRAADWRWLALGFCLVGIETVMGLLRWRIFLRVLEVPVSFGQIALLYYLGLFFNYFLVGVVGGDLVRIVYLIRAGYRKTATFLSVLMDRTAGLIALVLVTLMIVSREYVWLTQKPVVGALLGGILVYLAIVIGLLVGSLFMARFRVARRLPTWLPLRGRLIEFEAMYGRFVHAWPQSMLAVGFSMVMFTSYFLVFYCSARAFGVDLGVIRMCALMPIVDIVSALPVSLGGMGVREQVFVLLLGQLAGVSAATAVSISMTGFLLSVSWGVLGAVAFPIFKTVFFRENFIFTK